MVITILAYTYWNCTAEVSLTIKRVWAAVRSRTSAWIENYIHTIKFLCRCVQAYFTPKLMAVLKTEISYKPLFSI